jgi:hypothetical protein
MWHVWRKRQLHLEFWCRKLNEIDHFEDLGVGWRIIFKCIFKK